MDAETMTDVRPPNPAEIALIVKMLREASGWTQETLAEISGLTARTVQRVEKGEPSSLDTRRALARALGSEDVDMFDRPVEIPTPEEAKARMDELKRNTVTLDLALVSSGKMLAETAESIDAFSQTVPDAVPPEAARIAAGIFDFLTEYVDRSELYTYTQKLDVHEQLAGDLADLRRHGFSLAVAVRKSKFVGHFWADKTPMPMAIGYFLVTRAGSEPKQILAPKEIRFG